MNLYNGVLQTPAYSFLPQRHFIKERDTFFASTDFTICLSARQVGRVGIERHSDSCESVVLHCIFIAVYISNKLVDGTNYDFSVCVLAQVGVGGNAVLILN